MLRPLRTVKAAFLAGFMVIFTVWLTSTYYVTRRLAEAQARSAAIYARFLRGQELLFTISHQVLLGSVHVRDALIEATDRSVAVAHNRLRTLQAQVDRELEQYVTRALKAGAHGYLLKDSADTDLFRAVDALTQNKSFFSPAVSRVMLDDYVRQSAERGITDRFDMLSEREREVFQLVAEGHVNKEIAELLHLSPSTVETHRAHIMEKLDVHSAAGIVLYAVRRGIIS